MTDKQPRALVLADALLEPVVLDKHAMQAAGELRRLHNEVDLQQCSLNVSRQMIEGYVAWIRKDEALLRQALEALKLSSPHYCGQSDELLDEERMQHRATIAALKQRLGEKT